MPTPLRPTGRARTLRLVASACVVALTVGGPARPAHAGEKPVIALQPGRSLVIEAPSPLLQGGKVLTRVSSSSPSAPSSTPSSCRASITAKGAAEFCDSYPVRIDAPPELILSGNLQLNATLSWKPGTTVQNCAQIGNCGTNEMGIMLWQSPPAQTSANPPADTWTAQSGGSTGRPDTPMTVAHVAAGVCPNRPDAPKSGICPIEYILVTNYLGENPYRLTIELVDNSLSRPVDGSIEDLISVLEPPPSAPDSAPPPVEQGPVTFAAPPFLPTSVGGAGAPRVDLPGLGGSAGFDGIGAGVLDDGDLVRKIVQRGPKALGPPAAVNGMVVALWLAALPAAGLAAFGAALLRRRQEQPA